MRAGASSANALMLVATHAAKTKATVESFILGDMYLLPFLAQIAGALWNTRRRPQSVHNPLITSPATSAAWIGDSREMRRCFSDPTWASGGFRDAPAEAKYFQQYSTFSYQPEKVL
jgi:hypothetical protein